MLAVLTLGTILLRIQASPSITRQVIDVNIATNHDASINALEDIANFAMKHQHALYAARKDRKMECGSIKSVSPIDCDICEYLVEELSDLVAKGSTQEDIVKVSTEACIGFKIEDDRVCRAVVQEFKASFTYFYYFTDS
jgi:hypothetical protein